MKETLTFDDWLFPGDTFAEHAERIKWRGVNGFVPNRRTAILVRVTITVESLEQDKP